jgi:hypothetical protein
MKIKSVNAAGSGFFHHLSKWILVYIFIIILLAGFILAMVNFSDEYFDSKTYTNYLFGTCVVLSSICFSWTRTCEAGTAEFITIKHQGERFLLAALVFLISSAMKYLITYIQKNSNYPTYKWPHYFVTGLHWSLFLAFIYAFLTGGAGVYKLFVHLFSGHLKKPDRAKIKNPDHF